MTIKHRATCFDNEVIVKQLDEGETTFQVSIQSAVNPLSVGNKLASYLTLEEAVGKLEQFCSFYSLARARGYYLKGEIFIKPEQREIPATRIMKGPALSEKEMLAILESTD